MDPKISFTNVTSFDFKDKLQDVKKDNKDNILSVDKETGNVIIYTFDQKIPSDLKKGLAQTQIVFEDLGEDDKNSTAPEINKFIFEVQKAGTKFDPTQHFNQLNNKISSFKIDLNQKVNIMNISNNINNQLDKLSEAINNLNIPEIEKWSGILTNTSKQIALDRYYVPDYGVMSLGRSEYKLAADLREITYTADIVCKHVKE